MCGFQYVGSTSTLFRYRFDKYKACHLQYSSGSSVPQMDLFRHSSEEKHNEFLEGIRGNIGDRLVGRDRVRGSFWQNTLNTFTRRVLMLGKWKHSLSVYYSCIPVFTFIVYH